MPSSGTTSPSIAAEEPRLFSPCRYPCVCLCPRFRLKDRLTHSPQLRNQPPRPFLPVRLCPDPQPGRSPPLIAASIYDFPSHVTHSRKSKFLSTSRFSLLFTAHRTWRETPPYLEGNRTVPEGKNRTSREGFPYFKGRKTVPQGKNLRTSREENPSQARITAASAKYKTFSKQSQDVFNNKQALLFTAEGWGTSPETRRSVPCRIGCCAEILK